MSGPTPPLKPDPDEQQLRQELSRLQHELRRVRDGLERNPSHQLERRVMQLRDNIELCERELEQISALLAKNAKSRSTDE